jgi:hypothetical protein
MENIIYATVKALSLYAQVEFLSADYDDVIPEWETGDEALAYGIHGVLIATKPDSEIEMVISNYQVMTEPVLCVSGELEIGVDGMIAGNSIAATVQQIDFDPGSYKIMINANGIRSDVTKINIVLNKYDKESSDR